MLDLLKSNDHVRIAIADLMPNKSRQHAALLPYAPPCCPLAEGSKRVLADIAMNYIPEEKVDTHLNTAVMNTIKVAGERSGRLCHRKGKEGR
jgi:hypothetical protein